MSEDEKKILGLAKSGDSAAMDKILGEYKYLAITLARKYYLLGGEKDDLIQEGMIGLFKAINSYEEDKGVVFKTYASRLVEREIISAIRHSASGKHQVLNDSVSLDNSEEIVLGSFPEQDIITEERYKELNEIIESKLSRFEAQVVKYYLKGYNYVDIAKMLGKEPKSIDNALSRIKAKLQFLKENI